jgi:hypothetical protein
MTTRDAMEMVRITLDENGIEYYDDLLIIQALEEAQFYVLEDCWGKGYKNIIGTQSKRVLLSGIGLNGISIGTITDNVLYPYGLNVHITTPANQFIAPSFSARWVDPHMWLRRGYVNPSTANVRSGRLQYTRIGDNIFHNGADGSVELFYIEAPWLPTASTPLAFDVTGQAWVVDRAAQILQMKAVDEPAHDSAGTTANITSTLEQLIEQRKEGPKR